MTQTVLLGGVVQINPTTTLKKGTDSKFVSMDKLEPFKRKINSYKEREYKGGSKFMNGDTLLARITPCLENGKTAFVDILGDDEVGAGSTEFVVLRAIEGVTDPNYIYYLSISPEFRNFAIQAMIGTSGRQRVQNDVLARYEFELPGIKIQQKIGEKLRTIDEKIELNRRMNETLEQMGQALFRRYFIDNPEAEGWGVGQLSDLFEITMGQSPPGSSYNENGEGVTFYQGRAEFGIRFPNKRLSTVDPKRLAKHGDTLLSVRAPVGDINQAIEDCCIGRGLAAISGGKERSSFCYYMCRSLQSKLAEYNSEGTVFGAINGKQLKALALKLPPETVIREFEKQAREFDEQILNNTQQIQTLTTIRDTLLPRLISGNARV